MYIYMYIYIMGSKSSTIIIPKSAEFLGRSSILKCIPKKMPIHVAKIRRYLELMVERSSFTNIVLVVT